MTDFTPLDSKTVDGYHYDPAVRELTVRYRTGATYRHHDVAPHIAAGLATADSPNGYLHSIVKSAYRTTKL